MHMIVNKRIVVVKYKLKRPSQSNSKWLQHIFAQEKGAELSYRASNTLCWTAALCICGRQLGSIPNSTGTGHCESLWFGTLFVLWDGINALKGKIIFLHNWACFEPWISQIVWMPFKVKKPQASSAKEKQDFWIQTSRRAHANSSSM